MSFPTSMNLLCGLSSMHPPLALLCFCWCRQLQTIRFSSSHLVTFPFTLAVFFQEHTSTPPPALTTDHNIIITYISYLTKGSHPQFEPTCLSLVTFPSLSFSSSFSLAKAYKSFLLPVCSATHTVLWLFISLEGHAVGFCSHFLCCRVLKMEVLISINQSDNVTFLVPDQIAWNLVTC